MKAGVAFSLEPDSAKAGREAARRAVANSGPPALTILFTTDAYDAEAVLSAVQKVIGASKLVGFCCGGIITGEGVFSQGVGVCVLSGDFHVATTLQEGLGRDPMETGRRTGQALLEGGVRQGLVLALPDGFQFNLAEMLRGLYSQLGTDFQYAGGGAGDNLKFFKTYQFTERGMASNAVAAAAIEGMEMATAIGHGWVPMGEPMVITRASGKTVMEIDGIPAFAAYQKSLGRMSREEFKLQGMLHPLGFPDVFGQYIIRDPLAVRDDGSIEFITEVPSQAVGNIMDGQIGQLVETAEDVARRAVSSISAPAFVLLFDCISRGLLMGERFEEEIQAIRQAVGAEVPLLGALSFGEIGSYIDVPLLHNKTTVIAVGGGGAA